MNKLVNIMILDFDLADQNLEIIILSVPEDHEMFESGHSTCELGEKQFEVIGKAIETCEEMELPCQVDDTIIRYFDSTL